MRIAVAREQDARTRELRNLAPRLRRALPLRERGQRVRALRAALAHLDPTQVLARGYSIVRDASGHVRTSSAGLAAGDALDITFSQGGADAKVTRPR
jgi:exodeoxyribonuclease VII large subunit